MRPVLLIFIFSLTLFANTRDSIMQMYSSENYEKACLVGSRLFEKYPDEDFISMVGFACLYSDYVDKLIIPITKLRDTEGGRKNSAFFAIALMQKKLLYSALIDNIDIFGISIPSIDYVLSKIFNKYVRKEFILENGTYIIKDGDLEYKMRVVQSGGYKKIQVDIFKNSKFIKTHYYW